MLLTALWVGFLKNGVKDNLCINISRMQYQMVYFKLRNKLKVKKAENFAE